MAEKEIERVRSRVSRFLFSFKSRLPISIRYPKSATRLKLFCRSELVSEFRITLTPRPFVIARIAVSNDLSRLLKIWSAGILYFRIINSRFSGLLTMINTSVLRCYAIITAACPTLSAAAWIKTDWVRCNLAISIRKKYAIRNATESDAAS